MQLTMLSILTALAATASAAPLLVVPSTTPPDPTSDLGAFGDDPRWIFMDPLVPYPVDMPEVEEDRKEVLPNSTFVDGEQPPEKREPVPTDDDDKADRKLGESENNLEEDLGPIALFLDGLSSLWDMISGGNLPAKRSIIPTDDFNVSEAQKNLKELGPISMFVDGEQPPAKREPAPTDDKDMGDELGLISYFVDGITSLFDEPPAKRELAPTDANLSTDEEIRLRAWLTSLLLGGRGDNQLPAKRDAEAKSPSWIDILSHNYDGPPPSWIDILSHKYDDPMLKRRSFFADGEEPLEKRDDDGLKYPSPWDILKHEFEDIGRRSIPLDDNLDLKALWRTHPDIMAQLTKDPRYQSLNKLDANPYNNS